MESGVLKHVKALHFETLAFTVFCTYTSGTFSSGSNSSKWERDLFAFIFQIEDTQICHLIKLITQIKAHVLVVNVTY